MVRTKNYKCNTLVELVKKSVATIGMTASLYLASCSPTLAQRNSRYVGGIDLCATDDRQDLAAKRLGVDDNEIQTLKYGGKQFYFHSQTQKLALQFFYFHTGNIILALKPYVHFEYDEGWKRPTDLIPEHKAVDKLGKILSDADINGNCVVTIAELDELITQKYDEMCNCQNK